MKILHVITNTELGGAQRVCLDLCGSAIADGHEVAVASMPGGWLWRLLPPAAEKFYLDGLKKELSPFSDIKSLFRLRRIINAYKPDIIHLHSSKAGVLGRLAGFKYRERIVYTVHGFDSIRLRHRVFLPLERIFQFFCRAIVPVSDYDKANLIKERITRNVHAIKNGISVIEPDREPESAAALSRFSEGCLLVMTVARIAPQKDLGTFLALARDFSGEKVKFVWIGGRQDGAIEDLRSEYDIPPNVLFTGDDPDARSLVRLCDVFVLFSNYEGLPITIIEAMQKAKPVIASDVGGVSELVDAANGFLVRTEAEARFALRKLLDDGALRQEMGERSFMKYAAGFSVDKMWREYQSIYSKLCEANTGGRQ